MLALVLALRFALELTLLAVYAWWGYEAAGVLGGAACAIAVAVLWGLLLSPKARFPLAPPVRTGVEVVVFLVAAGALAALGLPGWGIALVAADMVILLALRYLGSTTGGDPIA